MLDDFVEEISVMHRKLVHQFGPGARHRIVHVTEKEQGVTEFHEGEWALYTSPAVLRYAGRTYVAFTDYYGSTELTTHGVSQLVDPGLPYESVDESDPREEQCQRNMRI